MKRNLLALAVGAAFVFPMVAQAAPTVYGRINLTVDYVDVDSGSDNDSSWALDSNASRVGVKGNEKLNDEFTAVYKMEWEVSGDSTGFASNAGADLKARERYIGLKHYQWGTVRMGYIDSPFKNAEDSVDVFNDYTHLDMTNFLYGQNRVSNSINYVSPKFLDVFGINATFIPGERNDNSATACKKPTPLAIANPCNENHLSDGYSTAFSYEDDSLYLALSMDKEVTEMDAYRFNARYKMGDLTASAMYQRAENSFGPSNMEESIVLSAVYSMDKWTARGEYLQSNQETRVGTGLSAYNIQTDSVLVGVGMDYNFTQNTKAISNLAAISYDDKFNNNPILGLNPKDRRGFLVGVGMETRF